MSDTRERRMRTLAIQIRNCTACEGMNIPEDEQRSGILLMDEPDHMRIRAPFAKALYKRVAKCRPLVAPVVNEWLDALKGRARFDAMADFALRVPIDVIARILGVDNTRLAQFREWSEGAILGLDPFRTPAQTASASCGRWIGKAARWAR